MAVVQCPDKIGQCLGVEQVVVIYKGYVFALAGLDADIGCSADAEIFWDCG